MTLENRYYEAIEPLFHFRKVGWAESNTYIGASMALTSVHESRNAGPGAQIHALAGGLFVIEDGKVHEIAIRTSKHIFEKTYLHRPDHEFLDAMVAAGSLRRIAEPEGRPDYGACRKASKQYPKLTEQVVWIEHSREFETLRTAFPDLMDAVSGADGWKVSISDIGLERDVTVTLSRDGIRAAQLVTDTITGEGFLTPSSSTGLGDTAVLASIADSLPEGLLKERSEKRLRFARGFMEHLPSIQSHLAMAVEDAAFVPAPAKP